MSGGLPCDELVDGAILLEAGQEVGVAGEVEGELFQITPRPVALPQHALLLSVS